MHQIVMGLQSLQQYSHRISKKLEKVTSAPSRKRENELNAVGLDAIRLSRQVETFLEIVDKELAVLPKKKRSLLERTAMPVATRLKDELVNIQSQLIVLSAAA